MTTLIIIGVIWLIGAIISYIGVFKKQGFDYPIWYSLFWPLMLILYGIHKAHNS